MNFVESAIALGSLARRDLARRNIIAEPKVQES
jgi:hypothetical protein